METGLHLLLKVLYFGSSALLNKGCILTSHSFLIASQPNSQSMVFIIKLFYSS